MPRPAPRPDPAAQGAQTRRPDPNYRISIDDAHGPDHDQTFLATAQILARSGRTYTARGEHRRHKNAMALAAAVLDELHRQEPSHPLSLPPTKRQRRELHARQAEAT